jgi:hypothetical protein
MDRSRMFALTVLSAVSVLNSCGLSNKTLTVPATVMDMAQVTGVVDQNNSCTPPTSPAPMPDAWWNAQPTANQQMPAVGFQIWRNEANGGACQEHKDIAYRGFFQYDLSTVAPLKTVTAASITFVSKVLPPDATPNASNMCDARSGGLGSLWDVTPTIPFPGGMMVLPPNVPFPPGMKLVAFTLPWVPGKVGTHTTTDSTGASGASFTVDVTSRVQKALADSQPVIQFMFSGTDEAFPRPITPPASIDCLTLIEVQSMTVTYVGS